MALVHLWLLLSTVFSLYNVSGWPTASLATRSSRDGAQDLSVESNSTAVSPRRFHLSKRFDDARFTYYDGGLAACGGSYAATELIVALNDPQWNGGEHCFQMVTVSFEGQSQHAKIVDLCPDCPYKALDLSRGLFESLAPTDAGVINGAWDFDSGEGGDSAPPPPSTSRPGTTTRPLLTAKVSQSFPQSDSPSESPTASPASTKTRSVTTDVSSPFYQSEYPSESPTEGLAPPVTITITRPLVTAAVSPSLPQSDSPSESSPPPPPPPTTTQAAPPMTTTNRCLRRRS